MKTHGLWRSAEYNGGALTGLGLGMILAHLEVPRSHWMHSDWFFWTGFAAVLVGGEIARRALQKRLNQGKVETGPGNRELEAKT